MALLLASAAIRRAPSFMAWLACLIIALAISLNVVAALPAVLSQTAVVDDFDINDSLVDQHLADGGGDDAQIDISAARRFGLVVATDAGTVIGKIMPMPTQNRVRKFLGIRYAAPPVGQNRWRAPQPVKPWSRPRLAWSRGASCPQIVAVPFQSEDCLFVDVHAPTVERAVDENGRQQLLPVIVWVHGGAWLLGSGSLLGIQDPSYIVQHKNVVFVAMNFRLGALGFLVTEDLGGNYGLQDQRYALEWVQRNIRGFGGDPDRVTFWGESAGAMSIEFHLTAPSAAGLFHRVITESTVLGINYRTTEEAMEIGRELARKSGCGERDVKCLRSRSLAQIMYLRVPVGPHNQKRVLGDVLNWAPTIDGVEYADHPRRLIEQGKFIAVPVLTGFNRDETGLAISFLDHIFELLLGEYAPQLTGRVYEQLARIVFRDFADQVLLMYPGHATNETHNLDQVVALTTDYFVTCPLLASARYLSRHQRQPVHAYLYEFMNQFVPDWLLRRCRLNNACHAMELPYSFHSLQELPLIPKFSIAEHTQSHAMIDYWTDFAWGLDLAQPRVAGTLRRGEMAHDYGRDEGIQRAPISWPRFFGDTDGRAESQLSTDSASQIPLGGNSDELLLVFTESASVEIRRGEYRAEQCKMWTDAGYRF